MSPEPDGLDGAACGDPGWLWFGEKVSKLSSIVLSVVRW